MSGGVDSSVAAALLLAQGYDVAGCFMKNFSAESWSGVISEQCPWQQDLADAEAVCRVLGIRLFSLNFEREYRRRVIDPFFESYRRGRTPNPDIWCNREIKFSLFRQRARKLGYPLIATGHYARIKNGGLYRGVDPVKDQSYFLAALNHRQLHGVEFPLGAYTKREVRQLARRLDLPNADKRDSQGICFVGRVRLPEFLQQRIPSKPGVIRDTSGAVVGSHPGVWYYTIGQRHGLGIGGGTPRFVVKKIVASNTLIVAGSRHPLLYGKNIFATRARWIRSAPKLPANVQVKIRSQQPVQTATASMVRNRLKLDFRVPQYGIAAGQFAVLYQGDEVLGSAVIARSV